MPTALAAHIIFGHWSLILRKVVSEVRLLVEARVFLLVIVTGRQLLVLLIELSALVLVLTLPLLLVFLIVIIVVGVIWRMLQIVILPVAIRAITSIAVILLTWRLIVLVLLGLSPTVPLATISSVLILHGPSVILTVPEPSMLLLSSVERWNGSSAELLLTLPNLLHVVFVVIVRLLLD